jgi:hypothetical protein
MSDDTQQDLDDSEHVDADAFQASPPSDNPSGATIVTAYARRRVRAYPVFENEIRSISTFNSLSSICFSFMSAFVSFAVAIWVSALFVDKPPAEGVILSHVVAPACCVGAVVAACLADRAETARNSG